MEVVEVYPRNARSSHGGGGEVKLRVLFNGQPRACYHDNECPGAGVCAVNASWAADPGSWCMCNTRAGLYGGSCDQVCEEGTAILGINITAAILALMLSAVALEFVIILLRYGASLLGSPLTRPNRIRHRITPVCMTMFLVFIGTLILAVSLILGTVITVGFPQVSMLQLDYDGRTVRRIRPSLEMASIVTTAFGYSLSVCSVAVLPLTWINVAQRSLKLRSSQTSVIMSMSVGFIIFTLCFELAFYILAALDSWSEFKRWSLAAAICWGVVFFGIISLNTLALIKITQVKWTSMQAPPPRPSVSGRSTRSSSSLLTVSGDVAGMNRLMARIQIACVLLILSTVTSAAMLSAFSLRTERSLFTNPRCYLDTADLVYRSMVFLLLLSCAVCVWFVYPSVRVLIRVRNARTLSKQASSTTTSPAHQNASSSVVMISRFSSPVHQTLRENLDKSTMNQHHFLFKQSRSSSARDKQATAATSGAVVDETSPLNPSDSKPIEPHHALTLT